MLPSPWFMFGPAAWLALDGLRRGPDRTLPSPAEDWRRARVDVVITASRDQPTIVHCLAGLLAQTLRPRQVLLVDDGGAAGDHGIQLAREFARANGLPLQVVRRTWSIGRTATLKRQSREFDGEVLFVLDAKVVLASSDYIECCVRELHEGVGIAAACGRTAPLRASQRRALAATPPFLRWLAGDSYRDPLLPGDRPGRWWRALGDGYRDQVGALQQGLVERGLMFRHGGIGAPAGGAIAWRRSYLKDLFDRYEPIRGDDFTAIAELFLARALATAGYRAIRVPGVLARVQCAPPEELPRETWRDAIATLQSDHYFDPLLRSPWRAAMHRLRSIGRRREPDRGREQRRIREAYRQPFGERLTLSQGRPIGNGLLCLAIERVGLPAALLALAIGGGWRALAVLVALEVGATVSASTALVPRGRRVGTALRALAATPVRYALALVALAATLWFALLLWPGRRLRWHVQREVDGVDTRRPPDLRLSVVNAPARRSPD